MNIVFLLYSNRSGSTFLSSKLSTFECVNVSVETTFVSLLIENGKTDFNGSDLENIEKLLLKDKKLSEWSVDLKGLIVNLSKKITFSIRDIVEEVLYLEFGTKNGVFVVKDPRISFHANKAFKLMDQVKFIHVVRDPRAVISSQLKSKSSFNGKSMSSGAYYSAKNWQKQYRIIKDIPDEFVLRVKYENMIENIDIELLRVKDYLGLNVSVGEKVISEDYVNKIPKSQKHLHILVGKDANKSRMNAWKSEMSDTNIYIIQYVLIKELNEIGYEVENDIPRNSLLIIFSLVKEFVMKLYMSISDLSKNASRREYYKYLIKQKLQRIFKLLRL